jgi:glutamate/tyrosine decarboxylase-like PLP-dependent enzyme
MPVLEKQKLHEEGRFGERVRDSLTDRSHINLSGSPPDKSYTLLNEQLVQREVLENMNSRSKATTHHKTDHKPVDSKKSSLPFLKNAYGPDYYPNSVISRDAAKLATLEQSYSKSSYKILTGRSRSRATNYNLTYREESSSRMMTDRTCDDVLSDVKALKEKFKDELNIL